MIKKIIALCLVLTLVSVAFTGCKDKPVEEKDHPETKDVKDAVDDAGDAARVQSPA